ncbi:hypothetical protein BVC80_1215g16 [Macleaya cordata]|uniref:Movement protein binding protein 2C n=1 Tax=Macleaya cordata TaxID=56857 RepID=A0A200Q389_MACCD|nr:hypothetical protein BVC80_1215g16 [Macleaya cordata]
MFEQQQHFVDLHENGDPKSWLSGEDLSSPTRQRPPSFSVSNGNGNGNGNGSNFDKVLYKNLVEMVPLIESLMDRRTNPSFTRRASLIYTKTPSRESLNKKISEPKGRKTAQSIPGKKRRDLGDNDPNKNACADEFSMFSSRASAVEKDREELIILHEQVESLQKKLSEKEKLLKSTETSIDQMTLVNAKLDELKRQAAEKDSLIKSAHLQLSDAKIKLADKQAALEKLQWEASMSNRKAEKLQEDIDSMEREVSAFMLLLEGLTKNDSKPYAEDYDAIPYHFDQLPSMDDMNEREMQEMEVAREAYISAIAAAKENQDEESLAIAAEARLRLQSFVLRTKVPVPALAYSIFIDKKKKKRKCEFLT